MPKRYVIRLADEERRRATEIADSPASPPLSKVRARVLLAADDGRSDQQIAQRLSLSVTTVQRTRRRYSEAGIDAAIGLRSRRTGSETDRLDEIVSLCLQIEGVIEAAVVDFDRTECLVRDGGGETPIDATAYVDLVRAKLETMKEISLPDEIEDILVTLTTRYHLIRVLPVGRPLFLFVSLDRGGGNLALMQYRLRRIEPSLAG